MERSHTQRFVWRILRNSFLVAFLPLLLFTTVLKAQEAEVSTDPVTPLVSETTPLVEPIELTAPEEPTLPGDNEPQTPEQSATEETSTTETEEVSEEDTALVAFGVEDSGVIDGSRTIFESKRFAQVDESSGMLSHELPLSVPPGRNGVQPKLSLMYTSKPETEGSIVGYGWSLSIPYIQRLNKHGLDKMFTESYFTSSMSGELATSTASSTLYLPRVENGDFLKYQFGNNVWIVTDKKGTRYTFGTSTLSRQDDPSDTSRIYKWMLEEIRDTNDNYVKYEYQKDGTGQIYPSRIVYTGSGITDGIFEVEFTRLANADYATSSAPGFLVETKYRINEITSKVDGSWVRKYTLAYQTPIERTRALLASTTESGRDESGTITSLPPYVFEYQDSTTPGWTSTGDWIMPESFLDDEGYSSGTVFAEVNGDGLPDIIRSYKNTFANPDIYITKVYLHNGAGWTLDTSSYWELPGSSYFIEDHDDMGFRVFDVNGDGLDDILRSYGTTKQAYINTGTGWVDTPAWYPPVPFSVMGGSDNGVRIADVNGDGLQDLMFANNVDSNYTGLNTGNGWATTSAWAAPFNFVTTSHQDNGLVLVDTYGDGLPDFLMANYETGVGYTIRQYINNGTGWTTYTTMPGFVSKAFVENHKDMGYRMSDINGDLQTDFIQFLSLSGSTQKATFMDLGGVWKDLISSWNPPQSFVNSSWRDEGVRVVDFDGDGMPDHINKHYFNSGVDAHLNSSKKVDLLKKITYPTGGSTSVEYKTSQQYKDGSGVPYNNVPYPVVTVSKISHYDGFYTPAEWNYSYRNGYYYYGGPFEKKFPGFGLVVRTAPTGDIVKTYFHNGTSTIATVALGQYSDHIAKAGKPYRIEMLDSASNTYSVTINKWDKDTLGNDSYFVKLAQSVNLMYDGDGDHKDTAVSYTYDSLGNTTQKIEWGEVTGSADGSFTDTGSDKFTTDILYTANTTDRIYLPYQDTLKDQSNNKVKETKFYYDNLTLTNVTDGNLTKSEHWKESSIYIDYEKSYNGYGLVTQDKDPRDKITTYTYDTYNLYVSTSTNPLSQTTVYTYDYSLGKPKQIKNPNNHLFQTVYDGLDRVITEKQPDMSSPSTIVTKTAYAYTDNTLPSKVQKTDTLSTATSTNSYTYFDGLGRVIQTRKQSEWANTYSTLDVLYNNLGLKWKESFPYFANGTTWASSTNTSTLYTTYAYDPVTRISTIANAVGTTSYAYDQWKTVITDANGEVKDLQKDAYNQITSVVDHLATSTVTYSYEYNGLGNLTKITEEGGALRNFTYNGLGRRLTAEDLHQSTDSTFGTWTYGYDDAGNLTSRIDPKGQTVNYVYDDLNRLSTEDYTGKAGFEKYFAYDTCTYGKGKVCTAANRPYATTTYTYNPLGLKASESITISGTAVFFTGYSYDRQGNLLSLTYPDGEVVAYKYNFAGLPDSATTYIKNVDYSPLGQISHIKFGNNASTTNTYDATKLYRLTNKKTVSGATTLQDLAYTYDAVGNITKIVDNSNTNTAKTTDYAYDDLHRLKRASTTLATFAGNYIQEFNYGPTGNLLHRSDLGDLTYYLTADAGLTPPHAVKTAGGTTYRYDANGNLASTTAATSTLVWDHNNKLSTIKVGTTATTTYYYDTDGNRVRSVVNGAVPTYYPNKLYEYESNGTSTKYIYAQDEVVAGVKTLPSPSGEVSPSPEIVPYYHHNDHLGSPTIITDTNGAVAEQSDYYPYGTKRFDTSTTTERKKFTGQYMDDTGLQYHHARWYDPRIGRFISQDPAALAVGAPELKALTNLDLQTYLSDPQGMNAYSYANNNPVKFTDKEGKFANLAIGAGGAVVGQYIYDVYQNIGNNGFNVRDFTNVSPKETYAVRAAQGALIAGTGNIAALGGLGVVGQSVSVGVASGIVGAGGNAILGKPISPAGVAVDVAVGAVTYGSVSSIPKVPGRLPSFGTSAFMSGRHAQQSAFNLGIEAGAGYTAGVFSDLAELVKDIKTNLSSNQEKDKKKK